MIPNTCHNSIYCRTWSCCCWHHPFSGIQPLHFYYLLLHTATDSLQGLMKGMDQRSVLKKKEKQKTNNTRLWKQTDYKDAEYYLQTCKVGPELNAQLLIFSWSSQAKEHTTVFSGGGDCSQPLVLCCVQTIGSCFQLAVWLNCIQVINKSDDAKLLKSHSVNVQAGEAVYVPPARAQILFYLFLFPQIQLHLFDITFSLSNSLILGSFNIIPQTDNN